MPDSTSALGRLNNRPTRINEEAERGLLGPEPGVETPMAPVPVPVQEVPRQRAGKRSALDSLAEQLKPESRKVMFSSRIPEWLDVIVNRKILELKLAGATKMSKEAILTDALKLYLGVEEPE